MNTRMCLVTGIAMLGTTSFARFTPDCCIVNYVLSGGGADGPCSGTSTVSCENSNTSVPEGPGRDPGTIRWAKCTTYTTNGGFARLDCDMDPGVGWELVPGKIGGQCCWAEMPVIKSTYNREFQLYPCNGAACP